ncbi:hypothetical protein [Shimia sp. NS0008-38b]|uniref:hypothetical protein n=1 Tax=Shimia sp. NS0008-38b TaxID=3127653 RepID=UPI00333F4BE1
MLLDICFSTHCFDVKQDTLILPASVPRDCGMGAGYANLLQKDTDTRPSSSAVTAKPHWRAPQAEC